MARRSLQASASGIDMIRSALKQQQRSQEYIARVAGCSRQTIWSMLQGNAVDHETLLAVCDELRLDWEKIAIQAEEANSFEIDDLVKEVREQVQEYVNEHCSTMRILNMTQKIEIGDIYTNVNVLQKLSKDRQIRSSDLLNQSRENFERLARGDFRETGVSGLIAVKKHSRLMVFGKPGAGKTTFLKFLALQCSCGNMFPDLIPLFISLKEWAESPGNIGLVEHLIMLFASYGIAPNTQIKHLFLGFLMSQDRNYLEDRVNLTAVEEVLRRGRFLILLDGLDEVRALDSKRVIKEIERFSRQFPKNRFVITCRLAAKDYVFEKFTEVEVADFNDEQIKKFINNWFRIQNKDDVSKRLMSRLKENKPMKELAVSPILLTLLCLVFEDSGELSRNRADLYRQGIDLLLSRWDKTRDIERDEVYKGLSTRVKEEMLSEIAFEYFQRGEYFFKQESVEEEIASFLYNISVPEVSEIEDLKSQSCDVLKAVESQHGILSERASGVYSFSHLTFQEYLTARWIERSRDPSVLEELSDRIFDTSWREIFLLLIGMLSRDAANELVVLAQKKIEGAVKRNPRIQALLIQTNTTAQKVEIPFKGAAVRSFVLSTYPGSIVNNSVRQIALDLADSLGLQKREVFLFDEALNSALALSRSLLRSNGLGRPRVLELARKLELNIERAEVCAARIDANDAYFPKSLNYSLERRVDRLITMLPKSGIRASQKRINEYSDWWNKNGKFWMDQLELLIIKNYKIESATSDIPDASLNAYLEANKLLSDCINSSDCHISRDIRKDIEDTMLMSQAFIDDYRAP